MFVNTIVRIFVLSSQIFINYIMKIGLKHIFVWLMPALFACGASGTDASGAVADDKPATPAVRVGAERFERYLPLVEGRRVALFSNHTGVLPDGRHTLDAMLDSGVNVVTIFSPEHGFRGTADAGEHVKGGVDPETGIAIASLYDGSGRREPSAQVMDGFDVLVVDIQDVGLRFYTYYCTMIDLINACGSAGEGKPVVILDRPNPNGMTVDGPILDMRYASGVGRLPIPTVHGLTLGELALMARGEGWLREGVRADITVVPCEGYTHSTRYRLPVAPSPNLPTMRSIYLYPSMCYFEATPVSLGRGTDAPFEVYGHPSIVADSLHAFVFTPESRPGAKRPPRMGEECRGRDLRSIPEEEIIAGGINLEYLVDAYRSVSPKVREAFFTSFFEKLMGRADIRGMIERGMTPAEIKASWADDVERFRRQRKPYLLYEDTEPEAQEMFNR